MGEPRAYQRTGDGLEFDRAVFFSDAIFAIAMTLLVVTIDAPREIDDDEVGRAIRDLLPSIFSFFLSFAVIAFFWVGHHRFVSSLAYITPFLLWLNLAFLAVIAFVPFPTDILGEHGDTSIAVTLYAGTIAVVSLIDAAMQACAQRTGAFRVTRSPETFRYQMAESLVPVVVFGLSIPIALFDTATAELSWLLIIPAERFLIRRERAVGHAPDPHPDPGV